MTILGKFRINFPFLRKGHVLCLVEGLNTRFWVQININIIKVIEDLGRYKDIWGFN